MTEHRHTYKLPYGYEAEFIMTVAGGYRVEWLPCVPRFSSDRARDRFTKVYLAARDDFASEVAQIRGERIGVVNIGDGVLDGLKVFAPATVH